MSLCSLSLGRHHPSGAVLTPSSPAETGSKVPPGPLGGAASFLGSALARAGFGKLGVISPDSGCRSFDATANGYMRAEGVFVYLVKPLAAAERDGDRILAVIAGTAVNTAGAVDGATGSGPGRMITAPTQHAQAGLMRAACARAGLSPQEVDYIEAHATGTRVGDRIEGNAIREVFGGESRPVPLRVASVKSNVGHMEAAAFTCALLRLLGWLARHDVRERELAISGGRLHAPRLVRRPEAHATFPASQGHPYQLCVTSPGQITGLSMQSQPAEPPGPTEVEIDVTAAALNFRDVMVALDMLPLASYERSARRRLPAVAAEDAVPSRRAGDPGRHLSTPPSRVTWTSSGRTSYGWRKPCSSREAGPSWRPRSPP